MSGERILAVDDEEAGRELMAHFLRSADYGVKTADDGLQALALLEAGEEFELVLSNLMMPNLDGMGLLQHLADKYPDIPLVMVSAAADLSVALAAIRNGAYDYLLRPFEREQLLATVRRALENRRLKMEGWAYQKNLESLVAARTEQLRKAISDREHAYDTVLEVFGKALAVKHTATEWHCKRVTAYSICIARAMQVDKDQITEIARGAFLHDIGKLAVTDAILRKPHALTADETSLMREHCWRGYEMLKDMPFLAEATEIVYSHHENYDGTGYPRGLKGERISLGARIVAVANTLDAIISDLPHGPAQSLGVARAEIERSSGKQFDPLVVEVVLKIPDNVWTDVRNDINNQIHRLTPRHKYPD